MPTRLRSLLLAMAIATLGSSAKADPCKAIPDRGAMPSYLHKGAVFSGPVTYIGDGDSLCIAMGDLPSQWVEVRLADFYAPEAGDAMGPTAKAALKSLAMGKRAICVADHRSYDRVVARCTVAGRSLGDALRQAGIREGGRGR